MIPWRVSKPRVGSLAGAMKSGVWRSDIQSSPGAIEVLKYFEPCFWVLRNDLGDLVSSDPVHFPVGGQTHRNSHRQHCAGRQRRKSPVHTAFVGWASDSVRGGLPMMASAQQGNGAGHDNETTERCQQPLRQVIRPAGKGTTIPVRDLRLIANPFLGQQCQRAVIRRRVERVIFPFSSRSPLRVRPPPTVWYSFTRNFCTCESAMTFWTSRVEESELWACL